MHDKRMKLPSVRPLFLLAVAASLTAIGALILVATSTGAHDPACVTRDFEGSRFVVCAYDAQRDDMRLASRTPEGAYARDFETLEAMLGADAARVRFAMNAGMFNDAGAPIGLFRGDGEEQHALNLNDGPGNFHLKPNGVFWVDAHGRAHVATSESYALAQPDARWATQSGPMLVIDGALHPRIADDGPSRYVRNGVGVREGRIAYFVISSGAVSFGRFARFFRDELHCRNALFLDGAVSSLWAPQLNRRDRLHAIGPMIVVLNRT